MENQKQVKPRRPKSTLIKIAEVIPQVRETLGINKQLKINVLREIWPLITSFAVAEKSHPAYFDKDGNLVIATKSSTLATELAMQKTSILARFKEATKDTDITFKDLRFVNR